MNDDELDFERRLRHLCPANVSPHLRQRVAEQVRPARPFSGGARACLTSLAALVLVAVVVGLPRPQTNSPSSGTLTQRVVSGTGVAPSLWAYQQAAANSPDVLDHLLDLHARTMPPLGERIEPPLW